MSENRRRRPSAPTVPHAPEQTSPYAPPRQAHYEQPRPEHAAYQRPQHEQPRQTPPQNVIVNQISIDNPASGPSYFDGGLLQLIGYGILASIITTFTLGLAYPFAACMLYRWEAKHTVINGRRLRFDGTGTQLIGKWILWFLLTLVTLGICSFWLGIKLKQWRVKHTHFA